MGSDTLPDDTQRRALCELMHAAFIELRGVCHKAEQVHELAYAFHNLPLTMYGWGTWSWDGLRAVLTRYRSRFPEGGPDYATMLDAIRPSTEPGDAADRGRMQAFWVSLSLSGPGLLSLVVGPLKSGDQVLLARYEQSFRTLGLTFVPISKAVLREAARLRTVVPRLRTPDAIHVATAIASSAALFVTNDFGFRNVPGLTVEVLQDVLTRP